MSTYLLINSWFFVLTCFAIMQFNSRCQSEPIEDHLKTLKKTLLCSVKKEQSD